MEVQRAASIDEYSQEVLPFFEQHCLSCHGDDEPEGSLNLNSLNPNMETSSAARWALLRSKLEKRQMPPESEPRPKQARIDAIIDWIDAELKRVGKHVAIRAEYDNGNRVPHELLFGNSLDDTHSANQPTTRVRRLSPFIYDRKIMRGEGKGARGIVQPFAIRGGTTFKDMGAPQMDEPTTSAGDSDRGDG